jgi:hypothetical protein
MRIPAIIPQSVTNLAHDASHKESCELGITFATVARARQKPRNRRRRFGRYTTLSSAVALVVPLDGLYRTTRLNQSHA